MLKTMVVALLGESGTGKDTIKKRLCKEIGAVPIIRHTTRPIREGELEGNPYYFRKEIPAEWISEDKWMEVVKYNDWIYMTHQDSIVEGAINIGCYDQDSADQMHMSCQEKGYDFICFRIISSKKERLIRQLNREENPNVDEIVRRYIDDEKSYKNIDLSFNLFPIINSDLDKTVEMIKHII